MSNSSKDFETMCPKHVTSKVHKFSMMLISVLLSIVLVSCSKQTSLSVPVKDANTVITRVAGSCGFLSSVFVDAFIVVNAGRFEMNTDPGGETASIDLLLQPGETVNVEIEFARTDLATGAKLEPFTMATASTKVPEQGDIVLSESDFIVTCPPPLADVTDTDADADADTLGSGSTDEGSTVADATSADMEGTADSTDDSGEDSQGFTDLDLGGTDLAGTADAGEGSIVDINGDGIINNLDLDACNSRGGSDPRSTNDLWSDNCFLEFDINKETAEIERSPFYNSTYVMGIQRVLYCRGLSNNVHPIEEFANGFFGIATDTSVRLFQENEGLVVDGIVGPVTWGRMQELVEADDASTLVLANSDELYDAFGVVPVEADETIDCLQQTNFFGRLSTVADAENKYEGWELAKTSGESAKVPFSIDMPD